MFCISSKFLVSQRVCLGEGSLRRQKAPSLKAGVRGACTGGYFPGLESYFLHSEDGEIASEKLSEPRAAVWLRWVLDCTFCCSFCRIVPAFLLPTPFVRDPPPSQSLTDLSMWPSLAPQAESIAPHHAQWHLVSPALAPLTSPWTRDSLPVPVAWELLEGWDFPF